MTFFPYENLFIYHVDGILSFRQEKKLGRKFIGNWIEGDYSFLFFSEDPGTHIEKIISSQSGLNLLDHYSFSYEEWQGGGLEEIRIGNILITPPWNTNEIPDGCNRILLDPGVVFGNGLHPTTKDCVRALIHTVNQMPFERVIDIGTGTGILALCTAVLGAENVLALDLNPLCVTTARHNVSLNGLDQIVSVVKGKAEDLVNEPVDLVVANIHHEVVKSLFEDKCFQNHKRFIISGLMRTQAREVKTQIERYELIVLKEWDFEMTWYTMLIVNNQF